MIHLTISINCLQLKTLLEGCLGNDNPVRLFLTSHQGVNILKIVFTFSDTELILFFSL